VTGPFERRLVLPLQAVVFVPALLVARVFSTPGTRGIPQELTLPVILTGVLVVLLGVGLGRWYAVDRPDETEVLSASVLSGDNS
jgi:prepilin signal peptidase PulO-like enzyme (type II secretory pathway)